MKVVEDMLADLEVQVVDIIGRGPREVVAFPIAQEKVWLVVLLPRLALVHQVVGMVMVGRDIAKTVIPVQVEVQTLVVIP